MNVIEAYFLGSFLGFLIGFLVGGKVVCAVIKRQPTQGEEE